MIKLATNEKAALFLCGHEYWIVSLLPPREPFHGWALEAVEERSGVYKAENALLRFTKLYGPANWVHGSLEMFLGDFNASRLRLARYLPPSSRASVRDDR